MAYKTAQIRCPVCGSNDHAVFFHVPSLPIHFHVLRATRQEALRAPTGKITLAFCNACTYIWNTSFQPAQTEYSPLYDNRQSISPAFRQFLRRLAVSLIRRHGLHEKSILEIGCGDGEFLRQLCRLGNNRGIGVDPACPSERNDATQPPEAKVRFTRDFFSRKYSRYRADLVCFRQVLEHVADPGNFLSLIRTTAARKCGTAMYLDVPNADLMLEEIRSWDILYEHCSYFTRQSLRRLLVNSNFKPLRIARTFGRQYLSAEASATDEPGEYQATATSTARVAGLAATFQKRHMEKIGRLRVWFHRVHRAGKGVVIWGAGTKGISLVNTVRENSIEYIVDINPHKHGKYVPGAGQTIVGPDHLATYRPDYVLVMNPLYDKEIKRMTHTMGLRPKFVYP